MNRCEILDSLLRKRSWLQLSEVVGSRWWSLEAVDPDPSKFAVAAAPVAAAGAAPAAAEKVEEKKEEAPDESDEDLGFSLFD
ncbi:hypothetical protein CASFOL_002550 [Castilleja foliolosa]|uniref:Uncharacterized protein n=1 Tax=Castilleja foliolosa TaxID=1961234 RepID=A0ABD3EI45_9LAMI